MPDLLAGSTILAQDTPPAVEADEGTNQTGFSSTTYAQGTPVCGVTFMAPTTGRVMVMWGGSIEMNAAGGQVFLTAAVRTGSTIGSGTSVSAASDTDAVVAGLTPAGVRVGASQVRMVDGLTPGSTYNAVTEHRVSANDGDVFDRHIAVIPLS